MNAYEKIGRKLQEAREEAGLSQEELAKKIGCTQASLSNYELGKRRLYLADLQRIGQLLGKQITYFLDDPGEGEPDYPDQIQHVLEGQYLREILFEAKELPSSQRKSVLDYIRWQKDEGSKK